MDDDVLSRKGLSLERLSSFLELADAGGIAAAAPGHPVRQSLMSRQLRELESAFRVALVERKGRGLALTAAGHHLAQVVRETQRGLRDVAVQGPEAPPTWSLGAGDSLLHWWVIPQLGQRLTGAGGGPRLALKALSSADVAAQLIDARLDVGLVRSKRAPAGLHSRVLGRVSWALFVPRALCRKGAEVEDLLATVPLAMQQDEPALNEQLAKVAKDGALLLGLSCETFPQACRAVESGAFAALLPTLARHALPSAQFLELPLPTVGVRGEQVHFAWHARTTRTRRGAEGLIDELERRLRLK
jgi:DNA-binding transcriptional LysR family regulator